MRIPFLHRRERTIAEIAAKATRVGSAEAYVGPFTPSKRTVRGAPRGDERMRRIRAKNGLP